MSALRPYRLERELDSAFYHWLAWLPSWQPVLGRRRASLCGVCPRYVDALGLGEIPHAPLHGLFGAVEALLVAQFEREVDALYPRIRESGEWTIRVEAGVIRILTSVGEPLDTVLAREDDGVPLDRREVSADEVARARLVLVRTYWALFEIAVARLGVQRNLILRATDAHIEPKVRRLADELISAVTTAA